MQDALEALGAEDTAPLDLSGLVPSESLLPGAAGVEPQSSKVIGDYELDEELGRGGMGIVYRAHHREHKQHVVALKMITFSRPSDQTSFLKRFRIEIDAVAVLNHDHIVKIFHTGEHERQLYFTMQYVEGSDLRKELEQHNAGLPLRRAAELMIPIARAVHHAHEHGILHRDLKPGNILLAANGKPYVSDFGLARVRQDVAPIRLAPGVAADERPHITQLGQGMGSPGYTSPEQAEGRLDELTTASDVFSLGAILYHLITGRAPLPTKSWHTPEDWAEYVRLACAANYAKASSWNAKAGADLDVICARCLEPDPKQRPASAAELALQLERWLQREPIPWRPVPWWQAITLWAARKPALASLTIAIALAAMFGLAGESWRRRAAERTAQAQTANQRRLLQAIGSQFREDRADLALGLLARALRERPHDRAAAERLLNALSQRTFLVATTMGMPLPPDAGEFNPNENRRVLSEHTNAITVLNPQNHHVWFVIPDAHQRVIRSVRFSPDGKRLVSAAADSNAIVWDASSGARQLVLPHSAPVNHAEFSPDGALIVTACRDRTARLWDARNGQSVGLPLSHDDSVSTARFSADGQFILTASEDRTIRLWDANGTGQASEPGRLSTAVIDARFARDGRHVVTVDFDDRTNTFLLTQRVLWTAATTGETARALSPPVQTQPLTELRRKLAAHVGTEILDLALSPDGRLLAAGCADGAARLWLTRTLESAVEPMVHDSKVNCVRFSPDGRRLLTSTSTAMVRLWDVQTGQPLNDPDLSPSRLWAVAFSSEGRWGITSAGQKFEIPSVEHNIPDWLPQLVESFVAVPYSPAGGQRPSVGMPLDEAAWSQLPPTNQLARWIKRALGHPTSE